VLKCVVGLTLAQLSLLCGVSSSSCSHPYEQHRGREVGTDTTARSAAGILMAALASKPVTTHGDMKESVQQIAEAFTVIHRAVLDAANGTPP
jgi:hypothetical protein